MTISRGGRGVKIFTTDKEQLRKNVTVSGQRGLALDLVHGNAGSLMPSRAKRRFHGHRTLQALIREINRRLQAFKALRERAVRQRKITPSIQRKITPSIRP